MSSSRFDRRPRYIRKLRVRKKVYGTSARPRLTVFRSNRHIVAQVVDDSASNTVAYATSVGSSLKAAPGDGKAGISKQVGKQLGDLCVKNSISQVVFDRNGYKYHGRIKALADAVREAGVSF